MRRSSGINARSAKGARLDAAMAALRRFTFETQRSCVAATLDLGPCRGGHEMDHLTGRGVAASLKLDPRNVQRLCKAHHDWKHAHPEAARDLGLTLFSGDPLPGWPDYLAAPPDDLLWAIAEATTSSHDAAVHAFGELRAEFGVTA